MAAVHFHLEDRVAVITGGAQGIGAACARAVRAGRCRGGAVGCQRRARAGRSRSGSTPPAREPLYCHCNVSRKAEVDAALAATRRPLGPIDALVNNAGIFEAADFLDITESRLGRGARRQPEGRVPGRPGGRLARWRKAAAARSST